MASKKSSNKGMKHPAFVAQQKPSIAKAQTNVTKGMKGMKAGGYTARPAPRKKKLGRSR